MKLYNRELEEIENEERYNRIDSILKKQIDFLEQTYGIDTGVLQARAERLAVIETQPTDLTHFIEYKGKKQECKNPSRAAAFAKSKKQDYDGNRWTFENGIYFSDKSGDHTAIHELFHFFSTPEQMEFNENGVGFYKVGVEIDGYDREDNLIDNSYSAVGLNEGITDLLASKISRE